MIWTTSRGYMPGTNATLNAMEYYGWSGVDVTILTGGNFLPAQYIGSWPSIRFVDFNSFISRGNDNGWNYRFADIVYALKLFDDGYDVVLLWGGDLCVVDDFREYFGISESLNALVLGTNEHGSHYLDRLGKTWPYGHTWSVPYADVPFFVPRGCRAVLERMLEYNTMDQCSLSRMDGLNYAVRDIGARVHTVPGELWIVNVPYRWRLQEGMNKSLFVAESSTRLKSFHRKYWSAAVCRQYLPGREGATADTSRRNKIIMNRFYNFFNRECRVPWTEGLEVWDGS